MNPQPKVDCPALLQEFIDGGWLPGETGFISGVSPAGMDLNSVGQLGDGVAALQSNQGYRWS